MWAQVVMQLGLGYGSSLGPRIHELAATDVTTAEIGAEASHSGSYHILSMGQHFDEYVINPRFPRFTNSPQLPLAHPYGLVAGKIRDTGVTGNIGEAFASILACRFMNLRASDIAHVKPNLPFTRRRVPDYLMRLGPRSAWLPHVWPMSSPTPEWWPVESKSRATPASAEAAIRDGLGQLTSYWQSICKSHPSDVGYGCVVCFCYDATRLATIAIFLPEDQPGLNTYLAGTPYKRLMDQADRQVGRFIYGCN